MSGFFFKNRKKESKIGPVWMVGSNGRGEDIRKRYTRVNIVEILYTHICK
jgi:hypothetical protein